MTDRFTVSGYFELVGVEDRVSAVEPWLVSGRDRVGTPGLVQPRPAQPLVLRAGGAGDRADDPDHGSTLVSTQQQAMMTAAFLLMVPQIYLSGLIFPIENMPRAIQYVTYAVPLRYYARILRGIFLKGSGMQALWPEAVVLAIFPS